MENKKGFVSIYFFIAGECLKLQSYFLVLVIQMKQVELIRK